MYWSRCSYRDAAPMNPDNLTWHETTVPRRDRWGRLGLVGATVWFTGLSGSGKSTIANALGERLHAAGIAHYVLDADNLRHGLNGDLGFSEQDRNENVRRIGEVARLIADAGLTALVPVISPYRHGRDAVRVAHAAAGLLFIEVFVDTPVSVCAQRDPKGLYAKARSGELTGLTGVDAPYETPLQPDLRVTVEMGAPHTVAGLVYDRLVDLRTVQSLL